MLKIYKLVLSIILVMVVDICISAQVTDKNNKPSAQVVGIVDFEFAPLGIEITSNRRYIKLSNRTDSTIQKFRFGCLRKEDQASHLTRTFSPKLLRLSSVTIEPNGMFSFGTELGGVGKCNPGFESLVVSQVLFYDGRRWNLEDQLSDIN
jgi:hypothetical protein